MKFRQDLVLREIGGEYIIVDPGQEMIDMSQVFTFNETAAFIWKTLQNKEVSIESILKLLLKTYDIGEVEARQDAVSLMEMFEKYGLLVD